MTNPNTQRKRLHKARIIASIALLLTLLSTLLSACGDPQAQQQADKSKSDLDKQIAHAHSIGVPDSLLAPILAQEKKLSQTSAPLSLFSTQPSTDYYTNLQKRYHILDVQVRGLQDQATNQLGYQATQDMQDFENILAQRQAQNYVEAKTFSDILDQTQKQMTQAQYPKDFVQVSSTAKDAAQALRLLGTANDKLNTFQNVIQQLQSSNIDTTALTQQQQNDVQQLRSAVKAADYTKIINQLDAQLQGTTTISAQVIPYVGAAKLKQFSDALDTMKQDGIDITTYQQHLDADKTALSNAKTLDQYLQFSSQVDNDIASIQVPMLQGQAKHLVQQFHQEVDTWGNANLYHDDFDGKDYKLDYPYDLLGIGGEIDDDLKAAQTPDDYQSVIDLVNRDMTNLKAMEANYKDQTPWNQPHATDQQMLQYYKVTTGEVIVVSLVENAMRVYQDGKLIQAFQVITGRVELPSPPGFWHVISRQSPTIFKAYEPKGSAFWYPDTPIQYAVGYRPDGYFIHDANWRQTFGGHASLPHHDAAGDSIWTNYGSHGCINLPLDEAGWVYNHTTIGTPLILY